MSEPVQPLRVIERAVPAAATVAVAFSGMLYVTGYAYREALLRGFGLQPSVVEHSFQDTLASGYLALLPSLLMDAAFWLFVWFLIVVCIGLLRLAAARYPMVEQGIAPIQRITTFLLVGMIAFTALYAGANGGTRKATLDRLTILRDVSEGCSARCYDYHFTQGRAVGRLIAQDKDTMLIFTQGRVRVFRTDELQMITGGVLAPDHLRRHKVNYTTGVANSE